MFNFNFYEATKPVSEEGQTMTEQAILLFYGSHVKIRKIVQSSVLVEMPSGIVPGAGCNFASEKEGGIWSDYGTRESVQVAQQATEARYPQRSVPIGFASRR